MSEDLKLAQEKLIDLVNLKEDQELNLMELKCEIRKLKKNVQRLKKEDDYNRLNPVNGPIQQEDYEVLPNLKEEDFKAVKVAKKKPATKKKADKN